MATLRNDLPLFRGPEVSLADMENFRAQQMGDVRRGWVSTRIGTDANYALADLASARAQEDTARAEQLQARVDGLRQRQAMYTPRVSRLEQIRGVGDGGVGDAVDWAQGILGSGPASMLDPVAAAAAMTAAGTGLRRVRHPAAQLVGRGLQTAGAFAAPYAINQRQLTGEFYGQAIEDPTIMENYTPQQLDARANLQGAGAALFASFVPAIVGRGLGGAGLRAGMGGPGVGARTLGASTLEGATEVGENEISRIGLAQMNPDRVPSEDVWLDRLNEFAAGAVGSAPITAAGATADVGFRRVGATADGTANLVREKAGQVVDMYDGSAAQGAVEKTTGAIRGLFQRGKKVVDLYSDGTKANDIKDALRDRAQGAIDSAQEAMQERSILSGDALAEVSADDPDFHNKFVAEEDRRSNLVADRLAKMSATDPRATELFTRAFGSNLSRTDQIPVIDEAAQYILEKSNREQFIGRAEQGASAIGRAAGWAGKFLRRAGGVAKDAAKGAVQGFREGRKQNLQAPPDAEAEGPRQNQQTQTRQETARRAESFTRAQNFAAHLEEGVRQRGGQFTAVKPGADMDRIAKYMGDIGFEIADLAEQWALGHDRRPTREQAQDRTEANNARLRDRQATGQSELGEPASLLTGRAPNFDALLLSLNRIANDLNSAYGRDAAQELAAIEGMAAPGSEPFFRFLEEQLNVVQSREGAQATAAIRRDAQNEILRAFDPATTQRLLKAGINVHRPDGKRLLLEMVEAIHTGRAGKDFDRELAKVLGQDVLDGMLQAIDTRTQQFAAEYVDDADVLDGDAVPEMTEDGEMAEPIQRRSTMLENQALRAVEKGSGGKLYGFYGMDKPRPSTKHSPFRSDKRPSAKQQLDWDDHVRARKAEGQEPDWENDPRAMRRPRLIPPGEAARAIKLMERRLKVDRTPERMAEMLEQEGNQTAVEVVNKRIAAAKAGNENAQAWLDDRVEAFFLNRAGSWSVTTKSAADVLRERNLEDPVIVLAMYRDYMRQEAARAEQSASTTRRKNPENTEAIANYERNAQYFGYEARVASDAVQDLMEQDGPLPAGVRRASRITRPERNAVFSRARQYFQENDVVVAERLSDRDPNVLSEEEILVLHEEGQRAVDLARRDGPSILQQRGILTFASELADNKDKALYIPAARLVYLARGRRMAAKEIDFTDTSERLSDKDKDRQFLADLSEGIGMMLASGQVTDLPTSVNKDGEIQWFADGIPDDLMLATKTYGQLQYGLRKRGAATHSLLTSYSGAKRGEALAAEQKAAAFRKDEPDSPEKAERYDAKARRAVAEADRADAVLQDIIDNEVARRARQASPEEPKIPPVIAIPERTALLERAEKYLQQNKKKGAASPQLRPGMSKRQRELDAMTPQAFEAQRQEAVAVDQSRGELGFVGDSRQEAVPARIETQKAQGKQRAQFARFDPEGARNDPVPRKPHEAKVNTAEGRALRKNRKIGPEDVTPLDFSEGEVGTDQFAEQRKQSIMEGKVAPGVRSMAFSKARRDSTGVARGNELITQLQTDPAQGTETLLNWMRMAARPEFDKSGAVGGLHLAMPAAVALNKDMLNSYDPEHLAGLTELRVELARIIRDSDATPAAKIAVMRAMAPAAQAAKINYVNLNRMLEAVKGERAQLGAVDVETRTKAQINEAAERAVAEYRRGLKKAPAAEPVAERPKAGGEPWRRQLAATARAKPDGATKFIGRGFSGSVTAQYADVWGDLANSGQYSADDTVFVSAEGGREGVAPPDFVELRRATDAGATILLDTEAHRERELNAEEHNIVKFLQKQGYAETAPGTWQKDPPASAKGAGALVGKPQGGVGSNRPSLQNGPAGSAPRPATAAEMQAVRDFVRRVLGPKVKVVFKDITGYAGEWIDAEDTIVIAMTSAPGAMQVAYHEALHAFFSKFAKNNHAARRAFQELMLDPELNERGLALLDGYPEAQKQFRESAEERLAYLFQFWNAGMIKLPGEAPQTIFQKIKEFFRAVFGLVTDSERATAILEAFRQGKLAGEPSAAGEVIAKAMQKGMWTTQRVRKVDNVLQKARSLVMPSQSILSHSDSPMAQRLSEMLWTNPGDQTHGGLEEGYLNARVRHARQFGNLLSEAVAGLNDTDVKEVLKYLQQESDNLNDIPYKPQRVAAKKIRGIIQRFRVYMVDDTGLDVGDRGPFYFPRVWNTDTLMSRSEEFVEMLKAKYPHILASAVETAKGTISTDWAAKAILSRITHHAVNTEHIGPERDDGVLSPFFAHKETRWLTWLDPADIEPYLEKDMMATLTYYFHNGVRAAEYSRRFGNKGEKLEQMFDRIHTELSLASMRKLSSKEFSTREEATAWANRQMKQVHVAVGAMEGTLGKDISTLWRETSAWTTVYQNIRLLPLTLFASVVDPLGIIARGGKASEAFDAFTRGMREVYRSWKQLVTKDGERPTMDKWEKLAQDTGVVEAAMFGHFVADTYSSVYMSKTATNVNNAFFQINGMEGWNRGVRAGAIKSAALFLQRHKTLPDPHSSRWLKELGLAPSDIHLDENGELITDWHVLAMNDGMTKEQAQKSIGKVHYALARWVEGAIVTPNAAQRPGWASDPHYSMFFHLKQFMYSFHMTVLRRAVVEIGEGNVAPILPLLWYVPVMIASDVMRGMIQGLGDLPPHLQGMNTADWVLHGIERAGLLGIGTIGVDAQQDIFSLGGPMVEQITDSFSQSLGDTALRALPANPIYAQWVQ